MNKFKYKFNLKIILVIVLGYALSLACLIMNIIRIINTVQAGETGPYAIISIAVALLMSLAFIVIITSLLIDSSYVFEDKLLAIKFGLIKSTIDYSKIKQIVWFKENNKLTLYLSDESFTNVVINDNEYEAFAKTLQEKSPSISFHIEIDSTK